MVWWNPSWAKKKSITLTGTGVAQTDYQVKLDIVYDGDMKSDFSDLRFTNGAEDTLLDAWLESKIDSTSAVVWVECDTPANTVEADIYMYYGNTGAASDWDIRATMLDGDDFPGTSLNAGIWDNQYCNVDVSGGILTLDTFTNSPLATGVMGKRLLPITHIIESKIKNVYSGDVAQVGGSDIFQFRAGDCAFVGLNNDATLYLYTTNDGTLSYCGGTGYNINQYYNIKIVLDGAGVHSYSDGNELINSPISTNYPNEQIYLRIGGDDTYSPTLKIDWIFARKYAANPATYSFGGEESKPDAGWTGKIIGVTNPAKVFGIAVANISKIMGV